MQEKRKSGERLLLLLLAVVVILYTVARTQPDVDATPNAEKDKSKQIEGLFKQTLQFTLV